MILNMIFYVNEEDIIGESRQYTVLNKQVMEDNLPSSSTLIEKKCNQDDLDLLGDSEITCKYVNGCITSI